MTFTLQTKLRKPCLKRNAAFPLTVILSSKKLRILSIQDGVCNNRTELLALQLKLLWKQLTLLQKDALISHFGKLKRELFEIPFLQSFSVCYNSKLTTGEFYLTYWLIFNFLCPLYYLLVKNFLTRNQNLNINIYVRHTLPLHSNKFTCNL